MEDTPAESNEIQAADFRRQSSRLSAKKATPRAIDIDIDEGSSPVKQHKTGKAWLKKQPSCKKPSALKKTPVAGKAKSSLKEQLANPAKNQIIGKRPIRELKPMKLGK